MQSNNEDKQQGHQGGLHERYEAEVMLRSVCCNASTRIATTDYNVCTACREACKTFIAPSPQPPPEAGVCGECLHPESAHWETGCVGMVEPEHCECTRTFPAPDREAQLAAARSICCNAPPEKTENDGWVCSKCKNIWFSRELPVEAPAVAETPDDLLHFVRLEAENMACSLESLGYGRHINGRMCTPLERYRKRFPKGTIQTNVEEWWRV